MIVYAESSAILAWLLGESGGIAVREVLAEADFIVSSDLTLVECDRAFHRAHGLGDLSSEELSKLQERLRELSKRWVMLRLNREIVDRAREPFPEGPIRSLDALHLASAIYSAALIPETVLLTLDHRVRRCASAIGLTSVPPTM